MNHHQRKVLHAIFAHPVNANLDLKDVMGMLTALGAEMDAKTKSRIGITLNGQTTVLHLTQHSLLKAEVMQIRKFLELCGISAGAYPRSWARTGTPARSSRPAHSPQNRARKSSSRSTDTSFGPSFRGVRVRLTKRLLGGFPL